MSRLRLRRFVAAAALVLGAFASACSEATSVDGNDAPPSETPTPAGVVHVAPDTVTMEPGDSMYFVALDSLVNGSVDAATVEWSATAGTVDSAGLYRAPSEPGSYRVIAKSANGADSALVIVAPGGGPAISLAVSTSYWIEMTPASLSLPLGGTAQFTAAFKTSTGGTYTFRQVWRATGGTITSTGAYKAPTTAGTYYVIVNREGDVVADTARVTVGSTTTTTGTVSPDYKRPGFWIEVLPSTVSLSPATKRQFTAVGKTIDGKTYSVNVTWRATGGTITTGGYFTAPSSNGSYRVIAQRVGDAQTDTSTVTVGSGSTSSPTAPTLSAVVLTPGTASVAVGATQQFTAQGKMSDGSTGSVSVTWSATGGTVSTSGLYKAGTTAGTYRVIAVQQGGTKADTSAITVTTTATAPAPAPAPANGTADPTRLPAGATAAQKNVAAYLTRVIYNANGTVRAASASPATAPHNTYYLDPVTNVKVWKVTDANWPAANTFMQHEYSDGPAQISREWAPGKSTLWFNYYLVDFERGVGFTNYRAIPSGMRQLTFSKNPATPRIAFVMTSGGQLRRFDTGTMQWADTGLFPAAFAGTVWLQQDKDDRWFVANGTTANTIIAWNSQTGQSYTRTFSGLDEPYLERDGRYVLANTSPTTSPVWDLQTNTVGSSTAPGNSGWSHTPALRRYFVTGDNASGGNQTPHYRVDPSGAESSVMFNNLNGYSPDEHASGMWVQTDAELGGDLRHQWYLRTSYTATNAATGGGVWEGLAFLRLDGTDWRLLCHHYTVNATNGADPYYSQARSVTAIDGKLAMFDSNMNNAPRVDVFLAEVPVR